MEENNTYTRCFGMKEGGGQVESLGWKRATTETATFTRLPIAEQIEKLNEARRTVRGICPQGSALQLHEHFLCWMTTMLQKEERKQMNESPRSTGYADQATERTRTPMANASVPVE